MAAGNVVRWLRECFREDRSRTGVGDFMGRKVLHRLVIKGREELASGWMPEIVIPSSYGEKAARHAALYPRIRSWILFEAAEDLSRRESKVGSSRQQITD